MSKEFPTWPLLSDFYPNIKKELLRRRNKTFGENNKPRAVWARAVSNAVDITRTKSGATKSGEITTMGELRRDINIMVGGLLRATGAMRGGFEPVYQRVAKGRELRDRAMPGIESISVQSKGEYGSLRKITINWLCPSVEDLDILMPYWLSPGISVVVEWGWSNIGQTPIMINIDDDALMAELYRNPTKILKEIILKKDGASYAGNQDFFIGIITNFTWNMNEDGSFTCTTELTTFGETMLALNLNKDVKKKGVKKDKETTYGIREFVEKAFNEENLEAQRKAAGKDIVKTTIVEGFTDVSFAGSIYAPTIIDVPDSGGDIYITWKFLENIIINKHACPYVNNNKEFFAFKMDSLDTALSNDGYLFSRSANVLINNNGNPDMFLFSEQLKLEGDESESDTSDPDATKDGYLRNVYIKRSFLLDTFNNSETLEEALKKLLVEIRKAAFDLWDLKLQTEPLAENTLKVIDQKYVSQAGLDKINTLLANTGDPDKNDEIYNFGGYSGESVLRSVSFTSKMTNQVALTHFFGRNKDMGSETENIVYSDDSDIGVLAVYGAAVDRVLRNLRFNQESELKPTPPKKGEKEKFGSRLKLKGDTQIQWKEGKKPPSSQNFFYTDAEDIKLVSDYLRRQEPKNITKNVPIYPLEISVGIDGISGILPGNVFTLDNLPKAYRENGVFQVVEISHEVTSDDWVTTLRAFFRPTNIFDADGKDKAAPVSRVDEEEPDWNFVDAPWRSDNELT